MTSKDFNAPLDDVLLQRLRRHCRHAQAKVYQRYATQAWTLAKRLTGCESSAWDLVQDSFVLAFSNIRQLRDAACFGTWLRRILVSKAMDQHRHRRRERDHQSSQQQLMAAHTNPPDPHWLDLERALAALNATDRMVLWLHDAEGMTHAEIAAIGGHSKSWSKSRLVRARARMQALLAPAVVCPISAEMDTDNATEPDQLHDRQYSRGCQNG